MQRANKGQHNGQEPQPNSTLTSAHVEDSKMNVEHKGVYNNKEEINIPSNQEEEILGHESLNDDSNSPATQTKNQLCPYESVKMTDNGIHINDHKSNNDLAIVPFPTPIQTEDITMAIPQSPNEVLHNILTHKVSEIGHLQLRDTNVQVEDLSPRSIKSIKSVKKNKKQGNGESIQPIRFQPKRQVTHKK